MDAIAIHSRGRIMIRTALDLAESRGRRTGREAEVAIVALHGSGAVGHAILD